MPVRTIVRRIFLVGSTGRLRRKAAATLSAGLTLPVVLCGLLAMSGCRSDQSARPGLSSLSPSRWFAGSDENVDDEFELKPVPQGDYESPPIPPEPPGRAFVPPAAPAPEPDAFYGVRPTAGEEAEPDGPSWRERFRNLFRRESEQDTSPLKPVPQRKSDRRSAMATELPPLPPEIRPRRSRAVALGRPMIEPAPRTALSTELARHIEPVRTTDGRAERLPVIVPGRPGSRPVAVEPAPWPYPVSEQPLLASASHDTPEPEMFSPAPTAHPLLAAPGSEDGPALVR